MKNLQYWISQYLLDSQYQKGLDSKTLKAYRIDLTQFSVFMKRDSLESTREERLKHCNSSTIPKKGAQNQAPKGGQKLINCYVVVGAVTK